MLVIIPKKGDMTECSNYRTIALLNHMCKVLMMVLLGRLKTQVEPYLAEEQAGFRRDRSTTQQILMLRLIAEKAHRKATPVYNCFLDFQKAFDSIKHEIIQAAFKSCGVGKTLTTLLLQDVKASNGSSKSWGELGSMGRSHGRESVRRFDIPDHVYHVLGKSDGRSQRKYNGNLNPWTQVE